MSEMVTLGCVNSEKGQIPNRFAADDPVLGSRNLALIQDCPARTLLARSLSGHGRLSFENAAAAEEGMEGE